MSPPSALKTIKTSGFTLLESIVAITVLTFAIAGPLTLASQSIKTASLFKNKLIAVHLAQEGIELIKNYSTSNVLAKDDWLKDIWGAPGNCNSAPGCMLDAFSFSPENCAPTCPPLRYDPASVSYSYSTGSDSIFTREINLESISSDEVKIRVSISWEERFGPQEYAVEDFMLNWRP